MKGTAPLPSEKPRLRLEDILENIQRPNTTRPGTISRGFAVIVGQDAVERCLLRISEAARKLGQFVEALAPDIPWSDIRAVGNVLRHDYDGIDQAIIWKILRDGLPPLRRAVEAALTKMPEDNEKTP